MGGGSILHGTSLVWRTSTSTEILTSVLGLKEKNSPKQNKTLHKA